MRRALFISEPEMNKIARGAREAGEGTITIPFGLMHRFAQLRRMRYVFSRR